MLHYLSQYTTKVYYIKNKDDKCDNINVNTFNESVVQCGIKYKKYNPMSNARSVTNVFCNNSMVNNMFKFDIDNQIYISFYTLYNRANLTSSVLKSKIKDIQMSSMFKKHNIIYNLMYYKFYKKYEPVCMKDKIEIDKCFSQFVKVKNDEYKSWYNIFNNEIVDIQYPNILDYKLKDLNLTLKN